MSCASPSKAKVVSLLETLGAGSSCPGEAVLRQAETLIRMSADPCEEFVESVTSAAVALSSMRWPTKDRRQPQDISVSISLDFRDILTIRSIPFTYMCIHECGNCRDSHMECPHCCGSGRIPGEYMRMATGGNTCPACGGTGAASSDISGGSACTCRMSAMTVMLDVTPGMVVSDISTRVCHGLGNEVKGKKGDLYLTVMVKGVPKAVSESKGSLLVSASMPAPCYALGGDLDLSGVLGRECVVVAPRLPSCFRADIQWASVPIQVQVFPEFPRTLSERQGRLYRMLIEEEHRKPLEVE